MWNLTRDHLSYKYYITIVKPSESDEHMVKKKT